MIAFKMLLANIIVDVPGWVVNEENERAALKDEVLYKVTRRVKKAIKNEGRPVVEVDDGDLKPRKMPKTT